MQEILKFQSLNQDTDISKKKMEKILKFQSLNQTTGISEKERKYQFFQCQDFQGPKDF